MGLDTLNEFLPKDTDPVSMGDDAIRETRAATKASVGLEHYLNGYHKIPNGSAAARPPAGNVGRLYWNTDKSWLEYDNGAQWLVPNDRKASATVMFHNGVISVPPGTTRFELPFDSVIGDPGGYANVGAHQITMPANSIGTAYLNLYTSAAAGGYGGIAAIEQFDNGLASWQTLTQFFNEGPQAAYWDLAMIVHSGIGTALRCTFTNGTASAITISPANLWASPRFGYVLHGQG